MLNTIVGFFHPRELAVRAHLSRKLETELTFASLTDQPIDNNPLRESKNLLCRICNEKWRWTTGEQKICKKCDTRLFVVPDG